MRLHRKTSGFTLVELIVVIAIIAILATVSIAGFTRFIENARRSNDLQLAAQMTDLLNYHHIGSELEDLDAHDVRTIIEASEGGNFSFTPKSTGTVFVYLADSKEVVLADVDDIISGDVLLEAKHTLLLSDQNIDGGITMGITPEEVFGSKTYVLSTEGTDLAEVIARLRALSGSLALQEDFSTIEDLASGMGAGASKDFVSALVQKFDVDHTVFVNNHEWLTIYEEGMSFEVDHVIFANGIVNLPSMETTMTIVMREDLLIPKSVKTLESGSLTSFDFDRNNVTLSVHESAKAESGAFSFYQKVTFGVLEDWVVPDLTPLLKIYLVIDGIGTFEQADDIIISTSQISITRLQIDIADLPRSDMHQLEINKIRHSDNIDYYEVRAYSEDGLLGTSRIEVQYSNTMVYS